MGARLRAALLDEVRAAMARSKLDPAAIEQRAAQVEDLLDGSNFTNLALQMLDENVFERALGAIEQEFPEQPLVRARLLHTTADTLRDLGLPNQALDLATALEGYTRVPAYVEFQEHEKG